MKSNRLLYMYGALLAVSALAVVAIIGMKTRNLMFTCLIFSLASILFARAGEKSDFKWMDYGASLFPLIAFIVFAYRAAINLLALVGILQHDLDHYDAYNKCLNLIFLIFLASGSLTTSLIMFAQNKKSVD
ncbi:MAG: hypothetical protein ABI772_15345 [Bacteroidota bacterium]